jgi:hypothetical protein
LWAPRISGSFSKLPLGSASCVFSTVTFGECDGIYLLPSVVQRMILQQFGFEADLVQQKLRELLSTQK